MRFSRGLRERRAGGGVSEAGIRAFHKTELVQQAGFPTDRRRRGELGRAGRIIAKFLVVVRSALGRHRRGWQLHRQVWRLDALLDPLHQRLGSLHLGSA